MNQTKNRRYFIIALIFILVALVIFWVNYEKEPDYISWVQEREQKMKTDTSGGETPQETLNLLITTLEQKDFSRSASLIASQSPDGIRTWEEALEDEEREGNLSSVITILSELEPSERQMATDDYKEFINRDENTGEILYSFIFIRNNETGVWKIENI